MNRLALASFISLSLVAVTHAQKSPKEFFGHEICEDYWLANYDQLSEYWKHLELTSSRLRVTSIGKTEEGREQVMAIISDPANMRNLGKIREASRRIALAKSYKSDAEAMAEIAKSKTVIWIDGGLHANEVLGAQQLIETAWQLVSRKDEEARRILRDCVILLVHANPDGMDLVSNWFMRKKTPSERSIANLPRLYQKYAGHDNNRDFYQMNLAETRNMARVMYEEWFPQVVYNHHQSAPAGTIMYIPPFRNPFNYHVDALTQNATDLVGLHIHQRLISEGKGGTVMRDGASFSSWWNGGLRTTTYFHNMVGILTETWGPTSPTNVPFIRERQIPSIDLPNPVNVRKWHIADSLQYEISANFAILDFASRYRDRLLTAVYRAARNSIERGSKDHWTRYPARVSEMGETALTDPALRDARAYHVPIRQAAPGSVQRFLLNLQRAGIEVEMIQEPTGDFLAGDLLIRCDQAYRGHILDMFEPQDHPNDLQYPGGPPKPPYDNAGYTPAFQMGIEFRRLLDGVPNVKSVMLQSMPVSQIEKISPTTRIAKATDPNSFLQANVALKAGLEVARNESGDFIFAGTVDQLTKLQSDAKFGALSSATNFSATKSYKKPRIAILDVYGGTMPSGWTRWLLDEFQFDYTVVYPPEIDKGVLRGNFDVLIIPSDTARFAARSNPVPENAGIPEVWRQRFGSLSETTSVTALSEFLDRGGHIIAIGSSARSVARILNLPVQEGLTEVDAKGTVRPLPNSKFFIPGSVLRAKIHPGPLTKGVAQDLDVLFDESPTWVPPKPGSEVSVLATFETEKPLRSGWAWGQEQLKGLAAMLDVPVSSGRVVLFGPEVNFRGQSHASFNLIFNAITRPVFDAPENK